MNVSTLYVYKIDLLFGIFKYGYPTGIWVVLRFAINT